MKIRELDGRLTTKLRLRRQEASRHTDYRLYCAGNIVALPTLLRVSHGDGEVANNNVGGIAKGLGLTVRCLKEMVGCRVGRACWLLCMSVRLLDFVVERRTQQGEAFRPGLISMLESVRFLLNEPELNDVGGWSKSELKAFERPRERLTSLMIDADCRALAQTLIDRMSVR